jgi:hypothetical protein
VNLRLAVPVRNFCGKLRLELALEITACEDLVTRPDVPIKLHLFETPFPVKLATNIDRRNVPYEEARIVIVG